MTPPYDWEAKEARLERRYAPILEKYWEGVNWLPRDLLFAFLMGQFPADVFDGTDPHFEERYHRACERALGRVLDRLYAGEGTE